MQDFGKPILHISPPHGEWLVLVKSTINSVIIQNLIDLYKESGFELYVHNLYGKARQGNGEYSLCYLFQKD